MPRALRWSQEVGLRSPSSVAVLRRAYLSRGGPVVPDPDLCTPRRACLPRGGPISPAAGLPSPIRTYGSRGGLVCPDAGLAVPRRACLSRGGPIRPEDYPEADGASETVSRAEFLGIQPCVKSLRSSYTGLYRQTLHGVVLSGVPRRGCLARGGGRDGVEGGVEVCDDVLERLDPHREPHLREGLEFEPRPHPSGSNLNPGVETANGF